MPRRSTRPASRSCWRATTTWCRPRRTSIRPNPTTTTRCCSRKAAPPIGACSRRAGSTPIRTLHPDAPMYTFWDYMRKRWERDAGLRLDQILLSARPAQAPGRGRGRSRRARRGRTPATMRRCGSCCATRGKRSRRRARRAQAGSARRQRRAVQRSKPAAKTKERRPLLVIDGDSFAHRAYHALPKTILRAGNRPAGAILGFANFLLRFYQSEAAARRAGRLGHARRSRPIGTKLSPPIRADANSTTRSSSSSTCCRSWWRPAASRTPRRRGYEADDFLAAAVDARGEARRHRAGRERRPRHLPARLGRR